MTRNKEILSVVDDEIVLAEGHTAITHKRGQTIPDLVGKFSSRWKGFDA
jgi:hypothetical protein